MALTEWDITVGGGGADVKSGIELGISEASSRAVSFPTPFAVTPTVVAGFADLSSESSAVTVHTVSASGFTIDVVKIGGGANQNRDVSWIATSAGNP